MNAQLRTSKPLKYMALVIFCAEFLSPVFLFAPAESGNEQPSHARLHDHRQASVSLMSLFVEEGTNEGEREGSRQKEQLVIFDLHFSFSLSGKRQSVMASIPFISQNQLHRASPPLYQLQCLLLI